VMEVPYAHEDQCRSCHIAIKGLISYDLSRQRTETGNFPPLIFGQTQNSGGILLATSRNFMKSYPNKAPADSNMSSARTQVWTWILGPAW
jgi:hypothetical protein